MVVESCIFILLDFAALVGNSLVCLAFYRNLSLRTVTNYFIFSLAITDLSAAVLIMPLSFSATVANKWNTGDLGCEIQHFFGPILAAVSLLTVIQLAINRYLRVIKPTLYPTVYSKKRAIIMTVVTWILSLTQIVLTRFISGVKYKIFAIQPAFCFLYSPDKRVYTMSAIVGNTFLAIVGFIITICYVKIYRTIHRHNTAVAASSQGGHSIFGVGEVKMTRMLTAVVVGYFLCYTPVFISSITTVIDLKKTAMKYYNFYFLFPVFTSSVINPILYAALSQAWRKEFRKILQCER